MGDVQYGLLAFFPNFRTFFAPFFFLPDLLWHKVQVLLLKFLALIGVAPPPSSSLGRMPWGRGGEKKKKKSKSVMILC